MSSQLHYYEGVEERKERKRNLIYLGYRGLGLLYIIGLKRELRGRREEGN